MIVDHKAKVHVRFETDPDGTRGFAGAYDRECSRTYAALATLINLKPIAS